MLKVRPCLSLNPRLCALKELPRKWHPRLRGARVIMKRSLVTTQTSYPWKGLACQRELGLRILSHLFIKMRGTKARTGTEERELTMGGEQRDVRTAASIAKGLHGYLSLQRLRECTLSGSVWVL